MPTYDFGCKACRHYFEVRRRMSDDSPVTCPKCGGGETIRLFLSVPTMFTRKIDHPDSPLDDLPGAEQMRKQADRSINQALTDMGMNP
ncbi:MAG: zinc ribbon domain-containing protein [Dehalococcoidia bacterium]